ncbi:MAG: sn-glycerol-3-phosphate ABC transporter ATP-binding protein UgpC [Acidimicrobiaceae bacterium]|nr:sn-glycerol-3-phosphate ABC transporter ATP-binding protein UgpC [Acidimicrobiaceae bacterium]MCY4280496.1 sn-glycerol-3-phosphate ABC transporter ATP-binding protein UgpC [Acidimicrobiaceae bacterium]MCY4295337.1 sn-glycerol-3-phosphate ABC transporter ATP-binding protein UgpC [Acidimicrobiaceae bacterium]
MPSLALEGLTKSYDGATEAVSKVTLTVADGEFLVLLGPSGCGKSTLLRMIAGLETVTSGELSIDGRSVANVHPRDRDIAMVFQNYALYPHMTVRKNLAYPLKLGGVPKSERNARVEQTAALLEIDSELERRPGSLSGGQRQRVAMGRALVREPSVFLMDEPLSNLDARLRMQMRSEISQIQRRLAITTVYVTHDQVEAMTMADRVVVMNKGRVQQIGEPTEVYEHPANLFVAGFIGSPPMNFFGARCAGGVVTVAGREIAPAGTLEADSAGSVTGVEAVVGVRPEQIQFGAAGPDELAMAGKVAAVETLGAETLCHVQVDLPGVTVEAGEVTQGDAGANSLLVRTPGNRSDLSGQDAELRVAVGSLHVFDPSTGKTVVSRHGTPRDEPRGSEAENRRGLEDSQT